MFGYLLLYRWSRSDTVRRVVVEKRGLRAPLLLCEAGAFKLPGHALDEELARAGTM
jgi:hypothetical protein